MVKKLVVGTMSKANLFLKSSEKEFYAQQIKLPGWGEKKQIKLKNLHALVVGLGGLGSPVAQYLAMAGVGTITLVDNDVLSKSNFNRQSLYEYQQVGQKKVFLAQKKLEKINPFINLYPKPIYLDKNNYKKVINLNQKPINIIFDATDNFTSTFLLHDLAFLNKIDLIQANVYTFSASLNVFLFSQLRDTTSCYRCLWEKIPNRTITQNCDEVGILGSMVGTVGSYQSMLGLEALLNPSESLAKFRKIFHFPEGNIDALYWPKKANCLLCQKENITLNFKILEKKIINNFINPSEILEINLKNSFEDKAKSSLENYYLYDLREKKSYTSDQKKILNQYNLLSKDKFNSLIKINNKEKKIIVMCQSGNSSLNLVAKIKSQNPHLEIFSLKGGLSGLM